MFAAFCIPLEILVGIVYISDFQVRDFTSNCPAALGLFTVSRTSVMMYLSDVE
jgi:hypothetical protein